MKTVLVTGSSSGLGKSIALMYASHNYNVIITYLTNKTNALELSSYIEKEYKVDTLVSKLDLSNEIDIINLKSEVINKFGTIDTLVNNAGISLDNDFYSKTKSEFMKVLEVNLVGTYLMCKHFSDIITNDIVNISSNNATTSYYIESIDYDASKSGIISLSHNLANYFDGKLRVNTVLPGWINTPMNKDLDYSFKDNEVSKILLKRFAKPEEVASLVYFLSSESASYINDAVINVDGGKKC